MANFFGRAERSGYEVLVTVDQGIPYQQLVAGGTLAVIVLGSATIVQRFSAAFTPLPRMPNTSTK